MYINYNQITLLSIGLINWFSFNFIQLLITLDFNELTFIFIISYQLYSHSIDYHSIHLFHAITKLNFIYITQVHIYHFTLLFYFDTNINFIPYHLSHTSISKVNFHLTLNSFLFTTHIHKYIHIVSLLI